MKKYLICFIICSVLILSTINVFAAKFSFDVSEDLNVDISETYTNGEHKMIPLRKTAENLGYNVIWNGEEMGIIVANENVNIKIYIGKDNYYIQAYEGNVMSNPVMVGAAPELKDGKTYVPAVMLNMLNFYNNLVSSEVSMN